MLLSHHNNTSHSSLQAVMPPNSTKLYSLASHSHPPEALCISLDRAFPSSCMRWIAFSSPSFRFVISIRCISSHPGVFFKPHPHSTTLFFTLWITGSPLDSRTFLDALFRILCYTPLTTFWLSGHIFSRNPGATGYMYALWSLQVHAAFRFETRKPRLHWAESCVVDFLLSD